MILAPGLAHRPTPTPFLVAGQSGSGQSSSAASRPCASERTETPEHRRLQRDLRAAAEAGEFEIYYQPRLSLGSLRHTTTDTSIRWTHRKRGVVPGPSFWALAESAGLATEIGGWMLYAACAEAACWTGDQGISVRVSDSQFHDEAVPRQLAAALEDSGLEPERLELRMTEATLMSGNHDLLLSLSAIRDLGVGITLDDFGETYASLSLLRRFPITGLKLDRGLVRGLPDDPEDAAIVRAALDAARAIGLLSIADGIETEDQRAFLSACGCDEGAGPLLSPPLPSAGLRQLCYG